MPTALVSPLVLEGVGPDTASQHSLAQSSLTAPTYQGSVDASVLPAMAPIHCFLRPRGLGEVLSDSLSTRGGPRHANVPLSLLAKG